jgi:hypothetical protein
MRAGTDPGRRERIRGCNRFDFGRIEMNIRICDIASELVEAGVEIPKRVHEMLAGFDRDASTIDLAMELFAIRRLMLNIALRLTRPEEPERNALAIAADHLWDGSMRDHFVEDGERLLAKPEVRELFQTVEDGEDPMNNFLDGLSGNLDQDLRYFAYEQLSAESA